MLAWCPGSLGRSVSVSSLEFVTDSENGVEPDDPPRTFRRSRSSCCGQDSDSDSASDDSSWCAFANCRSTKFHLVPKNGWHPFVREMRCSAVNKIKWVGEGPVPEAPDDCWMLPTSDEMSVCIAEMQSTLLAAGWKVLTCAPSTVSKLNNKASLHDHAKDLGLLARLPKHYPSPELAEYPCILKAALGQHGKDVYIVHNPQEVRVVTTGGFGTTWLLQELCSGEIEYSVSLLVLEGEILDAICTEYEYAQKEYVWPHVEEVGRRSHSDIPAKHLACMEAFLREYSGICNFNYKVRPDGSMCIFEVNTRVGADLACDVPRDRARALFQKLDALTPRTPV